MKRILLIAISITLLFAGCSRGKVSNDNNEKIIVYTSFYPLYFLADEIGGDNIDLKTVIPNGVESHDYEPSMNQLRDIKNADLFIYNGANFENWVDKLIGTIIDEDKTINASELVELIIKDGSPDPHIWMSLENMIKIGETIKDRFIALDEKNKKDYEDNFNNLSNRLRDLDNRYFKELKDKNKNSIIVSHEAFSYMAQRYGFKQIPVVGISPEQEPSPKTIAKIIELAGDGQHEYIFLETLASPKTVEVIAKETHLKTLTLNPIEGLTDKEQNNGDDYISLMEKNLENLKKALVK